MLHIPQGLALDIDDTLCHTGVRIIAALQKQFGNPEGLTADEIRIKYPHTSLIPYWNTPEHHIWKLQLIERDELYEDADIITNANHIIKKNRLSASYLMLHHSTSRRYHRGQQMLAQTPQISRSSSNQ